MIGRDPAKLEAIAPPFPRLRYDEAVEMLNQAHKDGHLEAPFEYGNDFGSPDETWLSSQYDRPVMVHRYPADVKAFYMEPDPLDARYALCVDVLAPEGYGEIIGGSQRVSSYELAQQPASSTTNFPRKPSSGTSTCAATAACRTRASAWALSASLPGSAASTTSAKRFPLPGRCTGCIREKAAFSF